MSEASAQKIPDGSVVITPTEMYAEIRTMHDEVRGVAAMLDPAISEIRTDITDIREDQKDAELRLRGLEKFRWMAAGMGTLLTAGVSVGLVEFLA